MTLSAEKLRIFRQGGTSINSYFWGVEEFDTSAYKYLSNDTFYLDYPSPANVVHIIPEIFSPYPDTYQKPGLSVSSNFGLFYWNLDTDLGSIYKYAEDFTPFSLTEPMFPAEPQYFQDVGFMATPAQFTASGGYYPWAGYKTPATYYYKKITSKITLNYNHRIEKGGYGFYMYYVPLDGPDIGTPTVVLQEKDIGPYGPENGVYPTVGTAYNSYVKRFTFTLPEQTIASPAAIRYGVVIVAANYNTYLFPKLGPAGSVLSFAETAAQSYFSLRVEKIYADTGEVVSPGDLPP